MTSLQLLIGQTHRLALRSEFLSSKMHHVYSIGDTQAALAWATRCALKEKVFLGRDLASTKHLSSSQQSQSLSHHVDTVQLQRGLYFWKVKCILLKTHGKTINLFTIM